MSIRLDRKKMLTISFFLCCVLPTLFPWFQGGTADVLMSHLTALIDFLLPRYMAEGKSNLIISIGCTGGKHRSVAIAEALSGHLRGREYGVVTMHRDYHR